MIVVSETATALWHYHLRRMGPEGPKPGGGAGPALCGAKLGWDVNLPVEVFMSLEAHDTFKPCEECRKLYGSVAQQDRVLAS